MKRNGGMGEDEVGWCMKVGRREEGRWDAGKRVGEGKQWVRVMNRNPLGVKCRHSQRNMMRCKNEISRAGCASCHAHDADMV